MQIVKQGTLHIVYSRFQISISRMLYFLKSATKHMLPDREKNLTTSCLFSRFHNFMAGKRLTGETNIPIHRVI